ncbi:hypothetical protein ACVMB1_000212 [Bradyrhizobium sp. USDA 4504]
MRTQARMLSNDQSVVLSTVARTALFAGFDGGAEHGLSPRSLIVTCKPNDVDPLAYLTEVPTRIVNGDPRREIDHLLPWAYRTHALKAVA